MSKPKFIKKYGLDWPPGHTPISIELMMIAHGGYMHIRPCSVCGKTHGNGLGLFEHMMRARELLWPNRYRHRWTELMYQNFIENDVTVLMGCASCVTGDTKLLNPLTGEQIPIAYFCDNQIQPMVMTLDGPELAGVPFLKGWTEIFEVCLSNGQKWKATGEHRVLTETGFRRVSSLICGDRILAYDVCHQPSSSGNDRQVPFSDARRYSKITEDSQVDYPTDSHSGDGRPPRVSNAYRLHFPQQVGVHKHTRYASRDAGGSSPECEHNHDCQHGDPLSNYSGPSRPYNMGNGTCGQCASDIQQLDSRLFQQRDRLPFVTHRPLPLLKQSGDSFHTEKDRALMPCGTASVVRAHIASIKSLGCDFYYDLEVPKAHHYFAEGAIHHNSQKTSHASEFVLLNYWARPNNTLVILSTVNNEKLDIGVWAEVKMLWQDGRDKCPGLAGNLIEYKRAIATDDIKETSRDFRRGIIGRPMYTGGRWQGLGVLAGTKQDYIFFLADECFVAGTPVDTTRGRIPIEFIKPGDEVISATGPNKVVACRQSRSSTILRITAKDGRQLLCTPNHPFFTQKGWVKACNLGEDHYMYSAYEAMRILRQPVLTKKTNLAFLQRILRLETHSQQAGDEGVLLRGIKESAFQQSELGKESIFENEELEPDAQSGLIPKGSGVNPSVRCEADSSRRERDGSNKGGVATYEDVPRREVEFCNQNLSKIRQWLSGRIQSGFGASGCEVSDRGRWWVPQQSREAGQGQKERPVFEGSWVDRVEVLQQVDTGFPNASNDPRGCRVYNLQVDGHPSYSVNGFLSHNCQFMAEAFSASWPHLFSNGLVKIIASGNPKHDDSDELAKTAEPLEGWAAHKEPEKTAVWATKFMGAKCVNLVGTDSPNFDVPEGAPIPYPRLINRQFAKRIEHDFGKDSFQYYQLVKGVMRIAFAHSRVITRQLCREHHAMESVTWRDNDQTHIYALDPTYGGDDRCVGRELIFGRDLQDRQILLLMPITVFKVNLTKAQDAEDQIAEQVAEKLDSLKVKPEDCFYDSFGKGTLGAAFARKFGYRVPTAVDAGGAPTERPVRDDLYIYEKDGSKRLKTCREHYKYFVSELWFSWRYTIEADQLRGLDEETMAEGCARIYEMVEGNKIQVEPKSDPKKKEDLKRRLGKSPDLADCTVIGVEGARQRGFRISRLGYKVDGEEKEVDFFEQEAREYAETKKKYLLVH